MSRLRLRTYREFAKVAERAGATWVRRAASRNALHHTDGRIPLVSPAARVATVGGSTYA